MAFNNVPANGWPQIKDLEKLDALAKSIENMPTFTSNDKAFLEELPAFPLTDGKKALTATTSEGATSLSYEEIQDELPNYSTTEQKTGRKWLDGRDVYFRTFDFSSNPIAVAYNNWTSLGVNIPNCDILLKCHATSGVTNLSSSGIEFEVKSSENYGLYAEYNQNLNLRSIKFLICEYVKTV